MDDDFQNKLLKDVFSDDRELRDQLLGKTLQHLRRRKQLLVAKAAIALCMVAAAGFWFYSRPKPAESPIMMVQPKKESLIVHSQQLPGDMLIQSTDHADFIQSTEAAVVTVRSLPAAELFRTINDEELFTVLDGHPAMLVRHGPNTAELVFVNPNDAKGFPVNSN